jgi:outer membrane receptor protein involved in Fe transport
VFEAPSAVNEVVIEAPRMPPSPSEAVFSIKRLDRETLSAEPRLDQALTSDPGVALYRRNSSLSANPTTQGVSVREIAGSAASRSLVTLDGAPINDPFGGWVIWSALAPHAIQSATIIRGAGAGPYGAGALTGTIALEERTAVAGGLEGEASVGNLADERAEGVGAIQRGATTLLATVSAESSGGYFPIRQGRGAVDETLSLHDRSASARLTTDLDGSVLAARVGVYREDRGSGLAGASSSVSGLQSSLSFARAPDAAGPSWRLQVWANASDLSNSSVSVAPGRNSASPANDQYATPATALGANAALRVIWGGATVEVGADVRTARGEDDELLKWSRSAFTRSREAGGDSGVAGVYAEASRKTGRWLLAAGVRLDEWGQWNGRRVEHSLTNGVTTLDVRPADQRGLEPTARLGARRDLGGGLWFRADAYEGFRPATLNELYRSYRVGNNVTGANATLSPERLWGVEAGLGAAGADHTVTATIFYNRLQHAVTNVSVARGPYTDPLEGAIPAGGILYRRENVGSIRAMGFEADALKSWGEQFRLEGALSWTEAQVDGGSVAPQLTGKRPAQTPRLSAVGTAVWRPARRLSLRAQLRLESARYADDLNLLRLAPDAVVDVRADWTMVGRIGLFVAADNLFDEGVQTDRAAGTPAAPGVVNWGAPTQVRIGFVVR